MEPIACWPNPLNPDLARSLDMAGFAFSAVTDDRDATGGSWSAAIVDGSDDIDGALAMARTFRQIERTIGPMPVMVLVKGSSLAEISGRHDLFDDFCLSPFHPIELEARLTHLLARGPSTLLSEPDAVIYEDLVLNLETYQATIGGNPLDLTYMEYELLKFLAQNPGRVFTRETLLSRVWGYEYYGGARTVDVHIRRLRAKLGEERAGLISTVRSVGYRFGESRWGSPAN